MNSTESPIENGKYNKFGNFSVTALSLVLFAFCALMALFSCADIIMTAGFLFVPVVVVAFIAIVFLSGKISNIKEIYTVSFLFLVGFFVRLIFIICFDTVQISDFERYYTMSSQLVSGSNPDLSFIKLFPELQSFVGLNALLMSVFGTNIKVILSVYALFSAGTAPVIYYMVRNYSGRAAFIAAVLFTLYPVNIVCSVLFSNQQVATFFFFASYAVLCMNKRRTIGCKCLKLALSGLLLAIAQIVRPIAIPVLIAVVIFYVIKEFTVTDASFSKRITHSLLIFVFIGVYFAVNFLSGLALVAVGMRDSVSDMSTDLKAYIYVGLNYESTGRYSVEIVDKYRNATPDEQSKLTGDAIKNIFENPTGAIKLFGTKMMMVWGSGDRAANMAIGGRVSDIDKQIVEGTATENDKYVKNGLLQFAGAVRKTDASFMFVTMALAALGIWATRKRKAGDCTVFLKWMLLGIVSLRMIIEIQSRYRYETMPALFMFAGVGAVYIIDRFKQKNNRSEAKKLS